MPARIYYHEPWCRAFDARVVGVEAADQPARALVYLDRTAFYPTSGGQPSSASTKLHVHSPV